MNELRTLDTQTISKLVLNGDMKGLTDQQKVDYYAYRCQQAGLDPSAKPFDILTLNGKMILYANAGCTQQLTQIHKLSHQVTNRELMDDIYCVFVRVTGPDGRSTENMGAVPVGGLKGEAKANAFLKATTKAIRRAVLAHCGLGMLDETEVDTIPGATVQPIGTITCPPAPAASPAEWSIEAQDAYAWLEDRAYQAFKAGGKPEAYEKFTAKWRARKASEPSLTVLDEMSQFVGKLEDAAAKAKPAEPEVAA